MTFPEAEDMNMISAGVVGLLIWERYETKQTTIHCGQYFLIWTCTHNVTSASLYGNALKHCGECFLIWSCTKIVLSASFYGNIRKSLWRVLPYMDIHSNIVDSASLYGHSIKTLWTVLHCMDMHSKYCGKCFLIWTYTQRWGVGA